MTNSAYLLLINFQKVHFWIMCFGKQTLGNTVLGNTLSEEEKRRGKVPQEISETILLENVPPPLI